MAGSTGGFVGSIQAHGVCSDRGTGLQMAYGAIAGVGREAHFGIVGHRVVEADDLVRATGLHAGQISSGMDLVGHHGKVNGVAGIGVGSLRRMAEDTHFNSAAGAAMGANFAVATVAGS